MIEARARRVDVQTVDVDGVTVELVSHATWLHVGSPAAGWGIGYRRPVRVVWGGSVQTKVTDHVMIARVALVILVAMLFLFRRIRS